MKIQELCQRQREYFFSLKSRPVEMRRQKLRELLAVMERREKEITAALAADLGKAEMEGYLTEIMPVKEEIRVMIRNLAKWSRPQRVSTPLVHFPARSFIYPEPKGIVLILAPWNYPFQLCMAPLVAAVAAGNSVMIKSSRLCSATSQMIADLIEEVFEPGHVAVVDLSENSYEEILAEKYDHILFTGSEKVGRLVMKAAAEHLTPVTLELGGKSPCIVDDTADIPLAAKRIAWGKFLNSGQTCVAPDYVLVHRDRKDALVESLKEWIHKFYGPDPAFQSGDYPQIIDEKHFDRLCTLLPTETEKEILLEGGTMNRDLRKIAPVLLGNVTFESRIMQEEIFGPILPILEYDNLSDVISTLQARPLPLALYLFTRSKKMEQEVLEKLRFGGGTINDTVIHLSNPELPFGGIGASGLGAYHGKEGFDTFSHKKSVLKKSLWLDLPLRYPPYTERVYRFLRRILHL